MIYRNQDVLDFAKKPANDTDFSWAKDFADFKKKTKFPVTLSLVKTLVKNDEKTGKPRYPNIFVPLTAEAPDPETGAINTFVYSKTKINFTLKPQDAQKRETHLPGFGLSATFTEKEAEKLYFLLTFSPLIEGSRNDDRTKTKYLRITDVEADNTNEMTKKRKWAKVQTLLNDEDYCMAIEELKMVAEALFIADISMIKGDNTLRNRVEAALKNNDEMIDNFLNFAKDKNLGNDRAIIARAFEGGIIGFNPKKNAVAWMNGIGNFGQIIFDTTTTAGDMPLVMAETYEFLKTNKDQFKRLKEKLSY